jgi:iron(III) transport system permease protein
VSTTWRVPRAPGLGSTVAVVVVGVLVVYPLVRLALRALGSGTEDAPLVRAVTDPLIGSAIWGTAWLTVGSVVLALPLALALAWICSSTDAPGAHRLALLPILSLALSPLVGAIGWLILLSPQVGIANVLLRQVLGLGITSGPFNAYSYPVLLMVMALYVVPFIYGPTFAAFGQIDERLLDAASVVGANGRTVFGTVVLPLTVPAVFAGGLIGGVSAASMFAIPLVLSSGTGLRLLPTLIYQLLIVEGKPGTAAVIASLLSVISLVGILSYRAVVGARIHVTVTGKGLRRQRLRLRAWRWPAALLVYAFVGLSLVAPLLAVIYLSVVPFWSAQPFSQPLTLSHYTALLSYPYAVQALVNSAWMALVAAVVALLLGLLVSYLRTWSGTPIARLCSTLATLPVGVPPIVLGLAFLFAFTGGPVPLYGTAALLVIGYTAHVLPMAVQNTQAGLRQVGGELTEAAMVAGDSRAGAVRRVVLPVLRTSLIMTWGLMFITVFRDLGISVLLYSAATIVSSVSLFNLLDGGSLPTAAAYALVITVISASVVWLVMKLIKSDSIL